MWTAETIHEFVKEHPLEDEEATVTSGSSEGDEYLEIRLFYWPHKKRVVLAALRFAYHAVYKDPDCTRVYLESRRIYVRFYTQFYGPD